MPSDLTAIQLSADTLKALEAQIAKYKRYSNFPGTVQQLSQITDNAGIIQAGEIRLGNGVLPGAGFTGLRLSYPPLETTEGSFHLAGFYVDQVMVGLDADDGALYWGYSPGSPSPEPAGMSGLLDASGIRILYNTTTPLSSPGGGGIPFAQRSLSFVDDLATGNYLTQIGVNNNHTVFITKGVGSTVFQDFEVYNPSALDKDAQMRLSASYIYQSSPALYNTAFIDLIADGSGTQTSKILLSVSNETNSAQIEMFPGSGIALRPIPGEAVEIDNHIDLEEVTAPGTPSTGYGRFYVKSSDSLPYFKDDGGTEHALTGGGGASSIVQRSTTDNVINTTAAETNLFSFSLPANTLTTDGILKIRARITNYNNLGAGAGTWTFKSYFGATALTYTISVPNNSTVPTHIEFDIIGSGATNSQDLYSFVNPGGTGNAAVGTSAIDTTSAVTVKISVTLPVSSASIGCTLWNYEAILFD